MKRQLASILFAGLLTTTPWALTGCDEQGPAERAGEAIDEANENTQDAREEINDAREEIDDAREDLNDETEPRS